MLTVTLLSLIPSSPTRDSYSIWDHQRSARLPPRFTLYAFYPHTIKVHENKSSWRDQTLRLTLCTYSPYCTSYNCSFQFFLDQIPWLQQQTFAITILPAYSPQGPSTRVSDIAGPIPVGITNLRSPSPWVHHVTAASRTYVSVLPLSPCCLGVRIQYPAVPFYSSDLQSGQRSIAKIPDC